MVPNILYTVMHAIVPYAGLCPAFGSSFGIDLSATLLHPHPAPEPSSEVDPYASPKPYTTPEPTSEV